MRRNVNLTCLSSVPRRYASTLAERNRASNALIYLNKPQEKAQKEGQLSGLKIAIKDNIVTRDSPTTCSSAILRNFVSPFDATVVDKLHDSGAEIIGKANCDEFGMGSLNTYSIHGPVINPFAASQDASNQERRSAGGSSGGSAAAVAAGLCDAALGTDTGGSVRLPASYCGVIGLKPSYGLVSRWGVVSYADSLDCVGVLAKDVDTTSSVFNTITGYDTKDPTSALPGIRDAASTYCNSRLEQLESSLKEGRLDGLKIGIPQEFFPQELSESVIHRFRQSVKLLKERGASIVPVSLPATSYSLSAYYVLASAEASSNMARYDGIQYGERVASTDPEDLKKVASVYARTRSANFGPEVQRRILLGTYALTADAFDNYFLQAQRVRQLVKNDFNNVFSMPNVNESGRSVSTESVQKVDVLLHPSAIGAAPLLDEAKSADFALDSYVQDVLTVPASLAGLPALSVPCLSTDSKPDSRLEWPIGVSIVGQWGADRLVLAVGKALETATRITT
ncbi:Glutamyl-tRNA amidotransferase subunit A, mitochondrial [Coprinopsis marcescibilis]|uniref:Glutamyl-tRNA(Gln) amidotransferase subunit A, mitochondrial n=1 Tax=Coprinopsis marcescibilis TaxID=230819 RepID=A0A5C3L9Z2_COPMA|nr:Glutamyl-tRNA amidotransferase subunit A, mitochondrial [Coprinopsis marcescibilis]